MTDGYLCDCCGEFVEATQTNTHEGAFYTAERAYHVGPCCVEKIEAIFTGEEHRLAGAEPRTQPTEAGEE